MIVTLATLAFLFLLFGLQLQLLSAIPECVFEFVSETFVEPLIHWLSVMRKIRSPN